MYEPNRRKIRQRGGSKVITIPPSLLEISGFEVDQIVRWRVTEDGLEIVPANGKTKSTE